MIMSNPGAVAPVVYGGKVRAVMLYMNRDKMQARGLSPLDVMQAMDNYNVFLPAGDAKFGGTDYAIDSNSMYDLVERMGDIPLRAEHGNAAFIRDVATPKDDAFIQTNIVRVDGRKQVYIPVFRQLGASTLKVVDTIKASLDGHEGQAEQAGDRPEAGHGPVGLRPPVDLQPGPGRGARGGPLLAGDPAVPRPDPDDGDRDHDAAAVGPGGGGLPAGDGQHDQRHDALRALAGDRADDRLARSSAWRTPTATSARGPRPRRRRTRGPPRSPCPNWSRPSAPSWCWPRWP